MNRVISKRASKLRPFRRHFYKSTAADTATPATAGDEHAHHILWRYQILAPDSDIVAHWNHVFLVTCIFALFIDPLYFFLPSIGGPACLSTDGDLGVTITLIRTITDGFFLLHMLMKFRTAFVAPSSRVFGRGELVMDPREIAIRYLKRDFVVDLAASLPIPQVGIYIVSLYACSKSFNM